MTSFTQESSQDLCGSPVAIGGGRSDNFVVVKSCSCDVEDQAAGLQHWNQEFIQLTKGRFEGRVDDIWFGNIQVFRDKCNQAVHQSGSAWEGSRTIAFIADADGEGTFSGDPVHKGDLVTLAGDQELDFRTSTNIDALAFCIDSSLLKEHAETVWRIDFGSSVPVAGRINADAKMVGEFADILGAIYKSIVHSPQLLSFVEVSRCLEEQVLNAAVLLCSHALPPYSKPGGAHLSRLQIVNRTKEYVAAHPNEFFTISDLCRHLNVSRRSLQYAFESICGTNPVTYLKAVRLGHVRRELKKNRGNAACTVGEIASRNGFWHLSRFSAEYRTLFGELPSETLGREPMKAQLSSV